MGVAIARYRCRLYPTAAQLLRLIEEKCERHGRYFARIGRFEPTSRVCSACGVKDGPKPLNVREWTCPSCGTVHDRDVNAAKNILTAGQAVTGLPHVVAPAESYRCN